MKDKKNYSCRLCKDNDSFYLELDDLSETCVQIWEEQGQKKAFVRIKFNRQQLEKILSEYKHIQAL